jgi:Uma2 family endonuclease
MRACLSYAMSHPQGLVAIPSVRMAVTADARIPMWPLTVDDFERMVDAGILAEDDRVELLNGQLSEMSPQGPRHAGILQALAATFIRAIDPAAAGVRVQLPLRLAPLSEPEPDIAVVAPGANTREHPTAAMLVIEIAVTSLRVNQGTKAEIYAAAGIPEYWVIDVPGRTVRIYQRPVDAAYGSCRRVTGGRLRPAFAGAPEIDVEALFALLD